MSIGVRFGNNLEENRIVVAHVLSKDYAYVLFVDDKQKDFDYLYEAFCPLFPTMLRADIQGDGNLIDHVARMDGNEHPIEKIELKESFDDDTMLSKQYRIPYTKEMVVALFGDAELDQKR